MMFGLGKEETLTIHVEGMSCAHCAARVENGLKKEPGVTDAKVSLEEKQVASPARSWTKPTSNR